MPISKHILDHFIQQIREHGTSVLASEDDANYFRNAKRYRAPNDAPSLGVSSLELPVPSKNASPLEFKKQDAKEIPMPPLVKIEPKTTPSKPEPRGEQKPVPLDFSSVRNVLSIVAPELAILNEIPNDGMAKKISERWKTKNQSAPISVLVYQELPEQRALLEQIAKALDVYFGLAKIVQAEEIEKEKQWEAFLTVADLKLIIVCDYTLWQLGSLMQFYKETPAQGSRVLGNIPLFLLPDLSLYLKDASLKRSLWKALCQKCS